MKYNFIKENGEIISTNNLSTIKKGLNWVMLNNLMPIWSFKKEEKEFLVKYGLSNSVFNVGCLQDLGMVYLTETDFKRLNEVKEKENNTELKIRFNENLSDSSIKMIKDILKDSLGFYTEIEVLK